MTRPRASTAAYVTATIIVLLWLAFCWFDYRMAGFDCMDRLEPTPFEPCVASVRTFATVGAIIGASLWLAASWLYFRNRKTR